MFSSRFGLSMAVAGMALGMTNACSDAATPDNTTAGTMGAGTMTSGSFGPTTGDMSSAQGSTTMGSATTGGPVTATATTGGTTGSTGAGGTSSSITGTTSDTSTTSMGGSMGTGAGGMGMGTGAGGTTGMGGATGSTDMGTTGAAADDLDMTAEQFDCIADWHQVLGFRINNLLGHLDEAIAVAENPEGGVYPVGTIIQHLPTEAMVKRKAGFSPETRDWEFFLLTLGQDGTTTIMNRGTTEISTMGSTCASCHSMADPQWDFVCNTYGESGAGNCGFDFGPQQLDPPIANDPRCD